MSKNDRSASGDPVSERASGYNPNDVTQWINRVRDAENNGEFLRAADHAETALELLDDHLSSEDRARLYYFFVRAVARSGAAYRASELFHQFDMDKSSDFETRALGARVLKDLASEQTGKKRIQKLLQSAKAYEAIYDESGAYFHAVNAATLYRLTGDTAKARDMAEKTYEACDKSEASYWKSVSIAEAALVLEDGAVARQHLADASDLRKPGDFAMVATTRKQLKLLCKETKQSAAILDEIALPDVLYFAGHIIAPPGQEGRFPASEEDFVKQRIEKFFDENHIGFAFGSLASGGDLLIAEECIRRNIEVHAVLPFQKQDFLDASVRRSEAEWVDRFEAVCAHIDTAGKKDRGSMTYATDGAYLGDDSLFGYCADFAMGLAMVKARGLDTNIRMLAVYDGKGGPGFGTNSNLDQWAQSGLPVEIISPAGTTAPSIASSSPQQERKFPPREPRAILFGDVKGFSALSEEMLPNFYSKFMSRLAKILNSFGKKVLYSNTWGDAVYAVFEDSLTAALCGLEFQQMIERTDFEALGLTSDLRLRLSAHYGPVFRGKDHIRNERTYFGSHVTKAARIEPITPPGEIYVTEAFAAALAFSGNDNIECSYMGNISTAKNFGNLRMYVLKMNR